jgi:hypothetical protein
MNTLPPVHAAMFFADMSAPRFKLLVGSPSVRAMRWSATRASLATLESARSSSTHFGRMSGK